MPDIIAAQILQKSGFKKADSEERVSEVLSRLRSSHEAIFVFEGERFLGLINFYYSLLKKRPRAEEKVGRLLYHPPKIFLDTPVVQIARLMVESRVYQLPVFGKDKEFVGVVSYRNILRRLLKDSRLKQPVEEVFSFEKPLFVSEKETVEKVRHLMIANRVSRLVVIDREGKPVGVLRSFDFRRALIPQESIGRQQRLPNKQAAGRKRIDGIYHRGLAFVFLGQPAADVVGEILSLSADEVLVFNRKEKLPVGIISVRDILQWWVESQSLTRLPFLAHFRRPIKEYERKALLARLRRVFAQSRFLKAKIRQVDFQFDSVRNRSWRNPLIIVKAVVQTRNQQVFSVSAKGKRFWLALTEVIKRIKRGVEKRG